MLPEVQGLFTLVRDLAAARRVTTSAASKWLVQRHGLAPLAATSGAAEFRPDLAKTSLAWATTNKELQPVLEQFRVSGLSVAPLKGFAYATTIYGHPAERPMSDIDLLVPPRQEAEARDVLVGRGFGLDSDAPRHHASTWVRGTTVIDLHRNIVGQGRSQIDLDALWSRTSPPDAVGLRRLDPTDELVFHLVHIARNRLRGPLMHVVDFARLERRTSASEALARAREWGIEAAVRIAYRFCRQVLDGDARRPGGWLGPTLDDIALFNDWTAARKLLFDLATAGPPRQTLARIAGYTDRRRVRR
jgi:hypothetical protein